MISHAGLAGSLKGGGKKANQGITAITRLLYHNQIPVYRNKLQQIRGRSRPDFAHFLNLGGAGGNVSSGKFSKRVYNGSEGRDTMQYQNGKRYYTMPQYCRTRYGGRIVKVPLLSG